MPGRFGLILACGALWVSPALARQDVTGLEPAAGTGLDAPVQTPAESEPAPWDPTVPPLPLRSVGAPAPPAPRSDPSTVHYEIQAGLDGEEKVLQGKLRLRWTNGSQDEVSDLWFHLYWNGFANNRSTHLIESGGRARGRPFKGNYGWQKVTGVSLETFESGGSVDLMPTFRYRTPDSDHEEDRTVFSVDLPRPVLPGQTIEVDVAWTAQIPRVRRRTGYKDDFLLMAHWFPKLGVYEGGRGWNCHEFHAAAEFFSDYGKYVVELDLPAVYEGKVFGSGGLPSTVVKGDRVVATFEAPTRDDQLREDHTGRNPVVHGFAWAADPRFEVYRYTFRANEWLNDPRWADEVATARRAFGEDADLGLRDVDVTVLIQPERAGQAERHYEATATALFFYGLWFGGYPYEHITVVDPRYGARGAGGMEYPTLFTAGTRLGTTPDMHTPESVTIHEAGHQFWYGLVGNNEQEASWMDEGFNSYSDNEALVRRYGPQRSTTSYAGLAVHGVRPTRTPGGGQLSQLLAAQEAKLPWIDRVPYVGRHLARIRILRPTGFVQWWRDQPALTLQSRWTDPRATNRRSFLSAAPYDAIDNRVWEYMPGKNGANSYGRTGAALSTLEGMVGREPFLRGMRHYADEWRYRHPYPDDFFATFQEGDGLEEDLDWFFQELFRGTGTADWAVRVSQKRESKPDGWFQADPLAEFVELGAKPEPEAEPESDGAAAEDGEAGAAADATPTDEAPASDAPGNDAEAPAPEALADDAGASDEPEAEPEESKPKSPPQPWQIEVTLSLDGTLTLPLPYRLTWDDGTVEDLVWSREEQQQRRWLLLRRLSTKKLVSVELDPERRYQVDGDFSNNQWFSERDELAPLRWGERVFSQALHLLHWQSRIGG